MKLLKKYTIIFLACSLSLNAPEVTFEAGKFTTGKTYSGKLIYNFLDKVIYTPIQYNNAFIAIKKEDLLALVDALKKHPWCNKEYERISETTKKAIETIEENPQSVVDILLVSNGLQSEEPGSAFFIDNHFIVCFGCEKHPNVVSNSCTLCQCRDMSQARDIILSASNLIRLN